MADAGPDDAADYCGFFSLSEWPRDAAKHDYYGRAPASPTMLCHEQCHVDSAGLHTMPPPAIRAMSPMLFIISVHEKNIYRTCYFRAHACAASRRTRARRRRARQDELISMLAIAGRREATIYNIDLADSRLHLAQHHLFARAVRCS